MEMCYNYLKCLRIQPPENQSVIHLLCEIFKSHLFSVRNKKAICSVYTSCPQVH